MEEALEDSGLDLIDQEAKLESMYVFGKSDLGVEKDNFYVEKKYVMPEGGRDLSYVALENVLLFKQVILGVVYTFVAFFMMFLVVNMVRDEETGLRPKWLTTPMSRFQILLGEYLSIVIGSMPMILMMTIIQSFYEEKTAFFLLANVLYAMAYGGLLLMIGKLFRKVTVYVVITSAIIIILGIVSGSFFLIDTSGSGLLALTSFIPTYKLLGEVVAVKLISATLPSVSYCLYMIIYSLVALIFSGLIEWFKPKSLSQ